MKKVKGEKKKDIGLKRLGFTAILSVVLCGLLGFGVLYCYFAPHDTGRAIVIVPALVGLDEGDIGDFDGLEIRREWIYSDDVERGIVISQTPYPNARRKITVGDRCPVTLYISLGEREELVPLLVGVDSLSAAAALRSIGARVRTVAIYGDGDDGVVIRTSPDFGDVIHEGETVTLYVSRRKVAEPLSVPDFCGMDAKAAVRLALSLGLFVGRCDGEGTVILQSIPSGARVMAESYICFDTDGTLHEREWPPVIQ